MKLKENFITQQIDDEQIIVSTNSDFSGMARSNTSAAFIVDCLKSDVSEDEIVDRMFEVYDAPRNVLAADVKKILNTLREIGALNE